MKYYTISEVARLTGKSTLTIKRWIERGKIPPPADPEGFSPDEVRAIVDKVARL